MKDIKEYVLEGISKITTKQQEILAKFVIGIFKDTKFTNQQVISMLSGVDIEYISALSKWFISNDPKNATFYMMNDDAFLDSANHKKIIESMSEYIVKYVQHN